MLTFNEWCERYFNNCFADWFETQSFTVAVKAYEGYTKQRQFGFIGEL